MKIDFGCRNLNITLSMHQHILHRLEQALGPQRSCIDKMVIRLFRFEDDAHEKDLFLRVLMSTNGTHPIMLESRSAGFFDLVDQLAKKISQQTPFCPPTKDNDDSRPHLKSVA
jgi:hypothetical protein